MTNCDWNNSKLEAYFGGDLNKEDLQVFQAHLTSCPECRQQVESLQDIDPLVRAVLQRRLAVAKMAAQVNTRPRVFKIAFSAAGLAAVCLLLVFGMRFLQEPASPEIASQAPQGIQNPVETPEKKDTDPQQDPKLAKPEPGNAVKPAPQPKLDSALPGGPDFSITDPMGYIATLDTYKGRVFLFGVVSPEQKAAVSNLQQVYDAFGSNPGVGILGVLHHRQDELRGYTFPLFLNNGSRLLGAQDGEFRLIDATGKTRLEGSLADPASVARIKSLLGQLGIR